jgi:signal transduction histidine kinase
MSTPYTKHPEPDEIPHQELHALRELLDVHMALTSALDPEEVIRTIAEAARRLTGAAYSWVDLVDGDTLYMATFSGEDQGLESIFPPDYRLPLEGSAMGKVILERETFLIGDAATIENAHPEASEMVAGAGWPTRSIAAVPLVAEEMARGLLAIGSAERDAFDEEEIELLSTFASSAVVALENARRYEEEQRRRQIADGLREILSVLNSDRSLAETLDFIVHQAAEFTGAASVIYRADVRANQATLVAAAGLPQALALDLDDLNTLVFRATLNRESARVPNVSATWEQLDAEGGETPPSLRRWRRAFREHFRGLISVPLIVRDEVYGALGFFYAKPRRAFSAEEVNLVSIIGEQTALALENARLHREELERRRVAEALRDALSVLNSSRPHHEILDHIVAQAIRLLNTRVGAIYIVGDDDMVSAGAARGLPEDYLRLRIPVGNMVTGRAVARREPVALADIPSSTDTLHAFLEEPGTPDGWDEGIRWVAENCKAVLAVPICAGDQVFGALTLYYDRPRYHTDEEIALAVAFADQAALVLEGQRLQDRLRRAAALEERNRLARGLHDAVTQTLFSASMIASVLPDIWDQDPVAGHRRLEQLTHLTRGALAEMRTMLLELRPEGLVEGHIGDLLRHLVDAAAGRSNLQAELSVSGTCELPVDVKIALYRIVQEALHNVTRHAEASHVLVSLHCAPDLVQLQVMDDGRGFTPETVTSDHMGLQNMRERVRDIGGDYELDTSAGEGTRITVTWHPVDSPLSDR